MGHFYTPPPSFIGGAQPYAPKLGIAQSGPVPQAPPIRGPVALAALGIIVSSWQSPYVEAQGFAEIAPLVQTVVAPTQPPGKTVPWAVLNSWTIDPVVQIPLCSIAALMPAVTQPPASANIPLPVQLSWRPAFQGAQGFGDIAPVLPVVSQPPVQTRTVLSSLIQAWQPPFLEPQGFGEIAPLVPAPVASSQPPVPSAVTLNLIQQGWVPPFVEAQGFADLAPLLPIPTAPSQPPVVSWASQRLILEQWQPRWTGPNQVDIAPILPVAPVASAPPGQSYVTLNLTIRSWDQNWALNPRSLQIPQPVVIAANPPPSTANLGIIRGQWESVQPGQQRSSQIAAYGFAPPRIDAPPPIYWATFDVLMDIWKQPWNYGQGFHNVAALPPAPIYLVGGPRYIIKRLRARRWTVSAVTYLQFEPKNADEKVKLTFDFGDDLPQGVTLVGPPTVTFVTSSGSDLSPSSIANGTVLLDPSQTQVVVPIQGGVVGCTYSIHAFCGTTDSSLALSLTGILPVIAG